MFMWMLYEKKMMKYIKLFMLLLHEGVMEYQNVYVNVTWTDNGISKCLCECCMKR
jgi:hypothetical protein